MWPASAAAATIVFGPVAIVRKPVGVIASSLRLLAELPSEFAFQVLTARTLPALDQAPDLAAARPAAADVGVAEHRLSRCADPPSRAV